MTDLLDASVQFPTVIFTIGLGIALVYWVFVLLGALDVDLLGGGDVAGAGKGVGDALVGGGKAGAELATKPDVAAKPGDAHGGVWDALGLASVPVTVSVSFVMLVGWTASVLGMHWGGAALGALGGWLSPIIFVVAALLAIVLAGVLARPLAPVFAVREGKTNADYVGHTCTVTTGHVDDGFGQATVEDGGTVLVIPVRCDRPGALARGGRALIIEFDASRQAYVVEPADPFEMAKVEAKTEEKE
jgi:hypothetical protein